MTAVALPSFPAGSSTFLRAVSARCRRRRSGTRSGARRAARLRHAFLESGTSTAGEAVLEVPERLAVADETRVGMWAASQAGRGSRKAGPACPLICVGAPRRISNERTAARGRRPRRGGGQRQGREAPDEPRRIPHGLPQSLISPMQSVRDLRGIAQLSDRWASWAGIQRRAPFVQSPQLSAGLFQQRSASSAGPAARSSMTSRSAKRRIRSGVLLPSSAVGPLSFPTESRRSSLTSIRGAVGPEASEVVVRPVVGVEHVHHHVPEIEQDQRPPRCPSLPITRCPCEVSSFSRFDDGLSCRSLPPLPITRKSGVPDTPPQVEHHHALGLLLLGGGGQP